MTRNTLLCKGLEDLGHELAFERPRAVDLVEGEVIGQKPAWCEAKALRPGRDVALSLREGSGIVAHGGGWGVHDYIQLYIMSKAIEICALYVYLCFVYCVSWWTERSKMRRKIV